MKIDKYISDRSKLIKNEKYLCHHTVESDLLYFFTF